MGRWVAIGRGGGGGVSGVRGALMFGTDVGEGVEGFEIVVELVDAVVAFAVFIVVAGNFEVGVFDGEALAEVAEAEEVDEAFVALRFLTWSG